MFSAVQKKFARVVHVLLFSTFLGVEFHSKRVKSIFTRSAAVEILPLECARVNVLFKIRMDFEFV